MSAHYALILAACAIGVAIVLGIIRASLGPTAFDRALAVNTIGTLAVLGLSLYGFIAGRPAFLDIALLYALLNFIGTIAVLKFFRFGTLGEHGGTHVDEHGRHEK